MPKRPLPVLPETNPQMLHPEKNIASVAQAAAVKPLSTVMAGCGKAKPSHPGRYPYLLAWAARPLDRNCLKLLLLEAAQPPLLLLLVLLKRAARHAGRQPPSQRLRAWP